ncbi:hypothetical protein [Dysgonomonas sp. 520]|uniref:hypothetical protein n=1 Tax=Dysgonomonas sp. 520 TaxID=2302931 RepID=UPI0013D139EF|nr:hypothetical protein [Dysgonomonas sp. 520]NDW11140.1 hypothetical protein [Dysgonomonas sp. 520]
MKELIGTILGIASLIIGSILGSKVAYNMEGFGAVICVFIGAIVGGGIGGWLYSVITNTSTNNKKQPTNLYEATREVIEPLVIRSYRNIAYQNGIAPTSKTSDNKIIEIYSKIGSAFKEASKQRNEHIPAVYLNTIVLKFYQVYEMGGDVFLEEHLKYEVDRYLRAGLREDYKHELKLF